MLGKENLLGKDLLFFRFNLLDIPTSHVLDIYEFRFLEN